MSESETPKIIVDSDWKSQAQAEKERLAREAEKKAAERPAGGGAAPGGAPGGPEGLPPADFNSLMGTLITQALMYLGAFPDQEGRAMVSPEHAKFHIDLLAVLEEKTRGNISEQESSDLKRAVSELRMRYVEISKAVADMIAKERAGGAGGLGGGGGRAPAPPGGMPGQPGV